MKRLLNIVAGLALFIILFLVLFGDQILQTAVTKPRLARDSTLTMTPVPRDIPPGHDAAGSTQLLQWGYTLSVPWVEVATNNASRNSAGAEAVRRVIFSSGQRIVLFRPRAWPDLLDSLLADKELASWSVRALFADWGHGQFYGRLFRTQPSDFSPFASKRRTFEIKTLLMAKGVELAEASVVYSFSVGSYTGYQCGNPETDRYCHILVFSGSDAPFQIRVGHVEEKGVRPSDRLRPRPVQLAASPVSQADIDQMIRSFRKDKT